MAPCSVQNSEQVRYLCFVSTRVLGLAACGNSNHYGGLLVGLTSLRMARTLLDILKSKCFRIFRMGAAEAGRSSFTKSAWASGFMRSYQRVWVFAPCPLTALFGPRDGVVAFSLYISESIRDSQLGYFWLCKPMGPVSTAPRYRSKILHSSLLVNSMIWKPGNRGKELVKRHMARGRWGIVDIEICARIQVERELSSVCFKFGWF
jgi:hypothetical protein